MAKRLGLVLLFGALVFAGALFLGKGGREAEAGFTSEATRELVAYLNADGPFNRKLMALEALRQKTETGIEAELVKLAKGSNTRLAVMATTALGRKKSGAAKTALKSLLESEKLNVSVRLGAVSAIAYAWRDSDDLSYLAAKTKDNTRLSAHYIRLKSDVFGK
jgi:hypothetical protein